MKESVCEWENERKRERERGRERMRKSEKEKFVYKNYCSHFFIGERSAGLEL